MGRPKKVELTDHTGTEDSGPEDADHRVPPVQRYRRGAERQRMITEAALRVIATDGIAGVTHRRVATEAGVPLPATTYYYASKDDLLEAAFRLHAEDEATRVGQSSHLNAENATASELSEGLAAFLVDGLRKHRHQLIAEYALLVEAAQRPKLAALSKAWRHSMLVRMSSIFTELGSPQPDLDAQLVLAVLAGFEVDSLGTSEDEAIEVIGPAMHRLIGALLPDR